MSKTIEAMQLELKQTMEAICRAEDGGKNLEVLAFNSRHGDLRLLFRVFDEAKWLRVLSAYLVEEEKKGWFSNISKKYMLKEGRMVYAWNMSVESPELDETVQEIRKMLIRIDDTLNSSGRNAVTEVPMPPEMALPAGMQARVRPLKVQ